MVYEQSRDIYPENYHEDRYKQFILDKERWDIDSTNKKRTNTVKFREKCCGDCVHHRVGQDCNSGSYTNCSITNRSVSFGERCNCGKFSLRGQ